MSISLPTHHDRVRLVLIGAMALGFYVVFAGQLVAQEQQQRRNGDRRNQRVQEGESAQAGQARRRRNNNANQQDEQSTERGPRARAMAQQSSGGGPQIAVQALLAVFDQNQDGQLSAEEISAASAVLERLDQNGDGTLARNELMAAAGQARGGSTDAQQAERFFAQLDRDQSGAISEDEMPENMKRGIDRIDENGDRQIQWAEFQRIVEMRNRGDRNRRPEQAASERSESGGVRPRRPGSNDDDMS